MADTAQPRTESAQEAPKEAYVPPVQPASAPPKATNAAGNQKRKQLLTWLAAGVAVAAVAWGAYYFMVASHYVSTDNAYVGTDVAQVTALVPGPIAAISVSETQTVKAGDVLLTIDNADAKIAVEQAQAARALAQRHVQGYVANDAALAGQINASQAEVERADAQIAAAHAALYSAKAALA